MTTITIERALLERVRNALESSSPIKLTQASITEHEFVIRILRSALAAPATALVVTKNESGQIVAVTRQDEDGRIVEVLAESATATAPEFPTNWAQMLHYPQCWDTAAYPELRDAIHEALAWSGCSVCEPANAPAWHDAQQAEIESLRWTVKDALESLDNGMTADCRATLSSATKETP